jgi:hypothetical protein
MVVLFQYFFTYIYKVNQAKYNDGRAHVSRMS